MGLERIVEQFLRCSRENRCPICGRDHYCLIDRRGPHYGVVCTKTESGRRWGEAGWYHGPARRSDFSGDSIALIDPAGVLACDMSARLSEFEPETIDDQAVQWLAEDLSVTAYALMRLGVGYWTHYESRWSFTFPMRHGGNTSIVTGIATRNMDGSKRMVLGSKLGLFIPEGLNGHKLYVVEGASDTAAGLDLGLNIIGRPGVRNGFKHVRDYIVMHAIQTVTIIADNDMDGIGMKGARELWRTIRRLCEPRIIAPPVGIKDLRHWKREGCTRQNIMSLEERIC